MSKTRGAKLASLAAASGRTGAVKPWPERAKETFESAGAFLAVMAVLLPLEGVVTRWVSFGLAANSGGFQPPPLTLAVDASIPELVATGLAGILPTVIVFIGVAAFAREIDWNKVEAWLLTLKGPQLRWPSFLSGLDDLRWPDRLTWRTHPRPRSWIIAGVAIISPIVISFYNPTWVTLSIGLEGGLVLGLNIKRSVSLVDGLFMAAAWLGVFAVASGLSGNPSNVEPMMYRFQNQNAAPHLSDGKYVTLGRSDGITYLQSCQGLSFHSVPDFQVVDAQYAKHNTKIDAPSIWDMIVNWKGPVVGYQPDC